MSSLRASLVVRGMTSFFCDSFKKVAYICIRLILRKNDAQVIPHIV